MIIGLEDHFENIRHRRRSSCQRTASNNHNRLDFRTVLSPVSTPAVKDFSQRKSLAGPSQTWPARSSQGIDTEGEVGRALLDLLGLWGAAGARPYTVKV